MLAVTVKSLPALIEKEILNGNKKVKHGCNYNV
jgi:hypothetical protein